MKKGETISAPPVAAFADTLRGRPAGLGALVEDGLAVFVACSSRGEARRTVYAFGGDPRTCRETARGDADLAPGLYALPGEVEEGVHLPRRRGCGLQEGLPARPRARGAPPSRRQVARLLR